MTTLLEAQPPTPPRSQPIQPPPSPNPPVAPLHPVPETGPASIPRDWTQRFQDLSRISGLAVLFFGMFILLGWIFRIPFLDAAFHGLNSMKANTALGFVLTGLSLHLIQEDRRSPRKTRLARFLAWGAAAVAAVVLSQSFFHWNSGLDEFLFRDTLHPLQPGRMAVNSSLNFILAGLALAWIDRKGTWFAVSRASTILMGAVTLLAVLGYGYGAALLYGWPAQTPMSFDTSACFCLLFVGILAARPRMGFMGDLADPGVTGTVTRILGTSVLVVLGISGWLVVALQRRFLLDPAFEVALLVAVNMMVSTAFIMVASRFLSRSGRDVQASREYAENIVETVRVSLLILDRDLKVVSANRSYFEAFQTTPERTLGRDLRDLESGFLDPAPLRDLIRKALQDNAPFKDYAIERDQPSLGRKSLMLNGKKVYRPGNHTELVLLSIEDITLQKQSLEDRERFFDVSQDLIALMGFDGSVRDANPAWKKNLGWTREEMLSHPFSFFLHPEDQNSTEMAFERSKTQPNITFENRYRHKDGSYRWLLWNTVPAPQQGLIYTSARDVTPARAAEAKMKTIYAELERESAQRLSLVGDRERFFDVSQDLIALMGFDGSVKDANPAWEKDLGWDREEMLSHPFAFFIHPDDLVGTEQAFERSKNQANITFENRYRHKDGTYRCLLWNTVPAPQQGLIYTSARDVTPARAAEARMKSLVVELEKESARRMSYAKELETFSYSVSHDLRAPLRSLDGFSLALLEDAGDKLDESGKDFLRRIRASSQKMAHLIDDMLQLSRITRLELHHQGVDLSQSVGEVARELGSQPGVHAVDFHSAPALKAWGDPHLIRILLNNLLGNAWKFTANVPSARVEFGKVEPGKDQAGAYFVRDNGAGFDMAYAAKLFVPFQRLHSEKDFPGTGVGLAICQRIVDKHGGRIWAEGTVGGGAAFYFTLEDIPSAPDPREGP